MEERRYRKNRVIFEEGDEPEGLYIVREGQVSLVTRQDGTEEVVGQASEGAILGGEALISGGRHTATARSNALNTRVLVIPAGVLRELLAQYPQLKSLISNP
jgi:CRP-like cAMP-binding protein